jgi:hypothetical protein
MARLLDREAAVLAAARGLDRATRFRWDTCAERVRQAYVSAAGPRR